MGVLDRAAQLQARGEAFAIATVVRTVSVTAAKAGAKAIVAADGSVAEGWIGGGCARAAVVRAAKQALQDGRSRLLSIAPKDGLDELGVAPGEDRDGVTFAKNACPSQGTMDIFVEPVLPLPRLLILGVSPVAVALASLAPGFGFEVSADALAKLEAGAGRGAYIVVSTQGAGDRAALKAAASAQSRYAAFVGSRRKAETLKRELSCEGVAEDALARVKAPAGLDIHAITAEEIALSILAEIIAVRRAPERADAASSSPAGVPT
jgi:xanthine dehydrogenase accessory factor